MRLKYERIRDLEEKVSLLKEEISSNKFKLTEKIASLTAENEQLLHQLQDAVKYKPGVYKNNNDIDAPIAIVFNLILYSKWGRTIKYAD